MQLPLCILNILLFGLDWQGGKVPNLVALHRLMQSVGKRSRSLIFVLEATGKETTRLLYCYESVKARMPKMTKVFCLYLGRVLCKIRQGCKLCLVAKRVPQLLWCSTAIHGSGNCLIPQARCSKNRPAKASSQCAIEFLLPIQTFQHLPTISVSQSQRARKCSLDFYCILLRQ